MTYKELAETIISLTKEQQEKNVVIFTGGAFLKVKDVLWLASCSERKYLSVGSPYLVTR